MQHRKHAITTPLIFAPLIPILALDFFATLYMHLAFPLYGLEKIKRNEYIRLDRHKLKYLNLGQKIYCMYCGYANGFLYYASAIAGRTEDYWCAIRHEEIKKFKLQPHQADFVEFGDAQGYQDNPSGYKRHSS